MVCLTFSQILIVKHELQAAADLLAVKYANYNQLGFAYQCGEADKIVELYVVADINCKEMSEDILVTIDKKIQTITGFTANVTAAAKAGPVY